MQIRKAMTQSEQRGLLTGIVEMDETFIGGKPRKGNQGRWAWWKAQAWTRHQEGPGNRSRRAWRKVTARVVAKDKMKGRHMPSLRAGSHRHI